MSALIIESIHIAHFGMLHHLDLDLDRGFQIIEGPNESGKSTLAAFIRFMLYGFSSHGTRAGVSERRRRVSWEGGRAEGSMTVCVKQGRYRIERLTEEVEGGRYREHSAIIDLSTGASVGARSAAGEYFFGVPEDVFLESAYFDQLSDTAVDGDGMRQSVENILFSGSERVNTLRAVNKLDEARRAILHKTGRGGVLYELKKQRDELDMRIAEAEKQKESLLSREAMLKDTIQRREAAQREETKFVKLESDYRNTMVIRTYDYLHDLEDKLAAVQNGIAEYERSNSFEGFFPGYEYLTAVAVSRRGAKDAYEAYRAAKHQMENLEMAKEEATKEEGWISAVDAEGGEGAIKEKYRTTRRRAIGFLTGGVAMALSFLVLLSLGIFFAMNTLLVPMILCIGFGVPLGVAGAVFVMNGIRYLKNARRIAAEYDAVGYETLSAAMERVGEARRRVAFRNERLANATENKVASRVRYERSCTELSLLAAKWGRELSPEEKVETRDALLDELVKEASAVITERGRLHAQVVSLEASIRETRRQLGDRDEISVRGTVAPADREKLSNLNHNDLLAGIEHCRHEIKFYEEKQRELEKQLIESRALSADPAGLAEQREALDCRIEELEGKYQAYLLAMESIASAGASLRKEISPRLVAYANKLIDGETDGKYPSLGVGDDMSVSVWDGEKTKEVEFFSAGTRDAVYFAVRMALVDLLYKESPPLCFDELLARQDDSRARNMLAMFARLREEGRQCFLFTCHKRDASLAEGMIPYRHFRIQDGKIES